MVAVVILNVLATTATTSHQTNAQCAETAKKSANTQPYTERLQRSSSQAMSLLRYFKKSAVAVVSASRSALTVQLA